MTGRVLGIDYGRRRVGLAVSDPLRTVATMLPHLPVQTMKEAWKGICVVAGDHQTAQIIVGLPLHLDGRKSELAKEAERFAEGLKNRIAGVQVLMWDERLSSKQAERALTEGGAKPSQKRNAVDSMAAQLILQSWLDSQAPEMEWEYEDADDWQVEP